MSDENKTVVLQAIDSWNAQDMAGYLRLYSENCLIHDVPGVPEGVQGAEAIRQYYEGSWSRFSTSRLTVDEIFGEGDSVAVRFTLSATLRGDFMGVPAAGKTMVLSGIRVLHFSEGQCVESWTKADYMGLMQQLAAVPKPGQAPATEAVR